jgi:hypothetical protein
MESEFVADRTSRHTGPENSDFCRRVTCYLENAIEPAELRRLQEELTSDPDKRIKFVELTMARRGIIETLRMRAESSETVESAFDLGETMVMPALRDTDFTEEPVFPGPRSALNVPHRHPASWWRNRWLQAASVALVVGGGVLMWRAGRAQSQGTVPVPTVVARADEIPPEISKPAPPPPLAVLTYSLNTAWDHTGATMNPGVGMPDGPHSLDAGIAQINLAGGASVVLQSPVQFEVISPTLVRITAGQVSASVPHGSHGLTLITPDMKAIDLGTEFGVNVSASRQTHMEVFTGKVRTETAADTDTTARIVSANQAVVIRANSERIEDDRPAPLSYVRATELQKRTAAGGDVGLQRWRAFSDALRRDPGLVAYYNFEEHADRPNVLTNIALSSVGKHDGILGFPDAPDSAPRWSTGRWPGKGALQFGETRNTAVILRSDGEFVPSKDMSIMFWLKRSELQLPVHLLNREYHGGGSFNVSIIGTAGKRFSKGTKVLLPNSIYFNYGPGEISLRQMLPADGDWLLVVITLDSNGNARFFLNGKLAGEIPMTVPPGVSPVGDICLGRSALGNADASPSDIFHGWMDELAIFHRTLSDVEVMRIFDSGIAK